jgi:two-component system, OmpR family, sensor kinase
MKLLNKIHKSFLINSVILFLITVILIVYITNVILHNEIDEGLTTSKNQVVDRLHKNIQINFPPYIEVYSAGETEVPGDCYCDTSIYLPDEHEMESFRQLSSSCKINNEYFKIVLRVSLIEKEDLYSTIIIISSIIIVLLIFALFYINKRSMTGIFRIFYENLNTINNFSITSKDELLLKPTNINEFEDLNKNIQELAKNAQREYKSLEELMQNLNHEHSTPIAVIKAKIELLFQNEKLDSKTLDSLMVISANLNRLDKINKSFILLYKLEKIKPEVQDISVLGEIDRIINNLEDIIKFKDLSIEKKMSDDIRVEMNESHMANLLNNLLSNSIKHNKEHGNIILMLSKSKLIIKNTGQEKSLDPDHLFDRFSEKSDSYGLGLSIIKKICDVYKFGIFYNYEDAMHIFTLQFPAAHNK